ncbi:MAG TPA: hypothetical protein VF503_09105 [Sphingobium sp.]|uniref:hypothetical protein n=1 Tax=Sphingobium sp. TaxID=1912891 RepID=UPI002ED1BACD
MTNRTSPAAGDLLFGAAAVAQHLNLTKNQVTNFHRSGELPTFKVGRAICARISTLQAHFALQEAAQIGMGSIHLSHGVDTGRPVALATRVTSTSLAVDPANKGDSE